MEDGLGVLAAFPLLCPQKVCEFRMGLDLHLPGGLCVAGGVPGYTARGSDRQTPEPTGGGGSLWRGAGQAFFLIEDLTGSCFEPLPQGLLLHELPDRRSCLAAGHQWRGYTVSSHTFLLTFCCLLMAEEAAVFAKYLAHGLPAGTPLRLVFLLNVLLLGLWNFLLLCTVVCFHQYTHKVVGAAVGTFAWFLTYGSWYHQPWSPGSPGHGLFPHPHSSRKHN